MPVPHIDDIIMSVSPSGSAVGARRRLRRAPDAIPIGPRMTQATRRRIVSQREWLPITGGIVAQPTFRLSRLSRLSLPLRVMPMLAHVDRGLPPTDRTKCAERERNQANATR